MESLVQQRTSYRNQAYRLCNEITEDVRSQPKEVAALTAKSAVLEKLLDRVEADDVRIRDLLHQIPCTQEEQDAECSSIVEFETRVALERTACDQYIAVVRAETISEPHSNDRATENLNKTALNLPKIEMQKYDDDLLKWLGFWAQFESIHEDKVMSATDKFNYLQQAMQVDSEAREIVDGFPRTADNYPKAVAALKDRFGRESLLLQVYVKELLGMVICNVTKREKPPLKKMVLSLQSHLRALNTLNLASADPVTWLIPLVEASLPEEVLRTWQRSAASKVDARSLTPPKTRLDVLMDFLKEEVQCEEQVAMAQWALPKGTLWGVTKQYQGTVPKEPVGGKSKVVTSSTAAKRKISEEENVATAAGLHVGQKPARCCVFCDKPHLSYECYTARKMSFVDRMKILRTKKVCFICLLPRHLAKDCKSGIKCSKCRGRHYDMMCPPVPKVPKEPDGQSTTAVGHSVLVSDDQKEKKPGSSFRTSNVNASKGVDDLVLLKTVAVRVKGLDQDTTVRVLLDDGSQKSYVTSALADAADCKVLRKYWEKNVVFGGLEGNPTERLEYLVPIVGKTGSKWANLSLAGISKISAHVPSLPRCGPWQAELEEKNISLADCPNSGEEIDVLLGADILPTITTGRSVKLRCGAEVFETIFGWALMGPVGVKVNNEESVAMTLTNLSFTKATVSHLWDLEVLGIRDPVEHKVKMDEDAEVKQFFLQTVSRGPDGRYIVSLPWRDGDWNLPDNRSISEKRLTSTTYKLNSLGLFAKYDEVFKDWELEGFIKAVPKPDVEKSKSHYLPHRAVVKESKTTPVRPVFDASCAVRKNLSLNDCLQKGPNLMELIPAIMLRFRLGAVGVISDVRKAFQMIGIHPTDQDYLRFLWYESSDCQEMKVYKHKRVVFGVTCSPYLLGAVIEYHLTHVEEDDQFLADKLLRSFYVDNSVTSVGSVQEYTHFKSEATRIMAEAKMELRQWEAGPVESSQSSQEGSKNSEVAASGDSLTSVLGMKWDKRLDILRCDKVPEMPAVLTKRLLLSTVQKIFDPMGFLSPALLIPKLVLQEAWMQKTG